MYTLLATTIVVPPLEVTAMSPVKEKKDGKMQSRVQGVDRSLKLSK